MRRHAALAAMLAGIVIGCHSPSPRLNAPPHGDAEEVNELQGTLVYMADNALLSDMTVSDIHYLPHRPQLTTLGEQRAARLAELVNAYGGTIRFSSNAEQDLAARRRETLVRFLGDMGVDTTAEVVTSDISGGRGMEANESALIKKTEGTYQPEKQEGGAQTRGSGGRRS